MAQTKTTGKGQSKTIEKRSYGSQNDIPLFTLEEALKVPKTLYDNFNGKPAAPHQVAIALDISPTSSTWYSLPGASIAYGLTTGGKSAAEISLTEVGRKIVAPENEVEDSAALIEACLRPRILKDFFERYDKGKFPKEVIAKNVLVSLGVPKEKVDKIYDLIIANGIYSKIIQDTKTGPFVYIDRSKCNPSSNGSNGLISSPITEFENTYVVPGESIDNFKKTFGENMTSVAATVGYSKPKIFISHGKNKKIVQQLKEILTYGQFEVVISVEKESTAIPVPEKVFADMRDCDAAVIHVEGELELFDKEGNIHHTINQNVLIEIGAAIALYDKQFILLCEQSLKLPSNLQGLYRCNYEGKELTYEATMKLLKAFNEIRSDSANKTIGISLSQNQN